MKKEEILLTAGLSLFLFLLYYMPLSMGDIWWHLSVGRWMSVHHQVPVLDPFPFANERTPWLHTPWLGSFALYEAYQWLGIQGLKFLKVGYILLVTGIFYCYSYRKIPFLFLLSIAVLMSYGLYTRQELKPDMANFFFVQIVLVIMLAFERSGNRRLLYVLPFLGALWFNIHIGALIYGTAILGIFWLASLVRIFQLKNDGQSPADLSEARGRAWALGVGTAGFLVAFLANPLGWEGTLYQLRAFLPAGDSRLFYDTVQNIPESMRPEIFGWKFTWFWALLALGVVFQALRGKVVLSRVLLFLAALVMFMSMHRNGAFFALVASYIIVDAAAQIDWTKRGEVFSPRKPLGRALFLIFIAALFFQAREAYRKVADGDNVRRFAAVNIRGQILADGVDFLKKNKLFGRILNPVFRSGGYIIWEGYPDLKPYMDGRNIDFRRYLETQEVRQDPEELWPQFDQRHPVDIILTYVEPDTLEFARHINRSPDWQLVFLKGELVIFVRRGTFTLPPGLDAYQSQLRAVEVPADVINILERGRRELKPGGLGGWIDPPPETVKDGNEGLALLALGYDGAGLQKIIKSAQQEHGTLRTEIMIALRHFKNRTQR